ncbi:MAG: 3-phosphoserine/phosphohydroxythreonine transaminase [Flavipsychrobacter sp.]|nr:3-phosphoserine/phosphohydroxythreonine transaminase [Flavipsychrobacter sp.]
MERKLNFNAGPAALPGSVLQEAAAAVHEYKNTGLSILELPHRSKEFADIVAESKQLVKELCGLDDSYEVLWLQGGGRLQFCMVPMNFASEFLSAGYIDSGHWAEEASEYAAYYGDVQVLASSKEQKYNCLPAWPETVSQQLAYLHLTTNNTIYGTQWHKVPNAGVPLIADMSSDILSMQRDYTQYAMFYAAAQKNLGAAGTALAVIRKDMLKRIVRPVAPMLNYNEQVKQNSILNTANVFGVYTSLLMLRWTKEKGIVNIEQENRQKAGMLYDALDNSRIFTPYVMTKAHRSMMNVCFTAKTPEQEKAFVAMCEENNITGIKGHRSVGGFRVSLYNAIPVSSVATLVDIMKQFEALNA